GPVVTFAHNEGLDSVLSGFTLRNGNGERHGGGVMVSHASPTIAENIIALNLGCTGAGVGVHFGSPLIVSHAIHDNSLTCTGGGPGGAGVMVNGASHTIIRHNVIERNRAPNAPGGG